MSLVQRVVVYAPAKINLFLDITGLRPDGYHLLDTVMQAISLHDIILIGRRREPGIRVTCSRPGIPEDSRNLVHRAAAVFAEAAGIHPFGIHIHIDKSIPAQAGLGGGSSDAAATLIGLNQLTGAAFAPPRLHEMALPLGADIPFLLYCDCARAEGIGESLAPLPALPDCLLVVAKPSVGVSTQEAYQAYDKAPPRACRNSAPMLDALYSSDLAGVCTQLYNVFEQVLPSDHTAAIQAVMRSCGALGAVLSGSGSAVVGLFENTAQAGACAQALGSAAEEVFVASPITHGAKILYTA